MKVNLKLSAAHIIISTSFIIASVAFIVSLHNFNKDSRKLKAMGENIASTILSNAGDGIFENPGLLKEQLEVYKTIPNIIRLCVRDNAGHSLAEIEGNSDFINSASLEKKIYLSGKTIGSLYILLGDADLYKKYYSNFMIMHEIETEYLWDYSKKNITKSLQSFLNNKMLQNVEITLPSGNSYVHLNNKSNDDYVLHLEKPMEKNGIFLGTLKADYSNLEKKHTFYLTIISAAIAIIFLLIFIIMLYKKHKLDISNIILKTNNISKSNLSDATIEKIQKAILYIEQNYRQDISREGLARYVSLNVDNFGRYFKQYTNIRINDFINELRIKEATHLIESTDKKIIDIAYSVGFENIGSFNRVFLKINKFPPRNLRNRTHSCNNRV